MCVSCMSYVDWELGGRKKIKGRDFLESILVRVGLQETNNFFRPKSLIFVSPVLGSCYDSCCTCATLRREKQ